MADLIPMNHFLNRSGDYYNRAKANLPAYCLNHRGLNKIANEQQPSIPEIVTPQNILSDSNFCAHARLVIKDFPPKNYRNPTSKTVIRFAQKSPEFCASLFHFQYCFYCAYDNDDYAALRQLDGTSRTERYIEQTRNKIRMAVSLFWNVPQSSSIAQHKLPITKIDTVKYEMKLLNAKEDVLFTECGVSCPDYSDDSADYELKLCNLPFSMFADKPFPEDKLIVQVEVLELNGQSPAAMVFNMHSRLPTEIVQKHSENFGSFLQSGQYSDFTVVVKGGREFKTHKMMLAAQSPVFAAMLEHSSTKEVREGRLEITDLDEDVFEQLLEFVYTGRVNDHFVADLFIAANKYQMDSLRTYCDHFMRFNLSDDTVSDVFILAGMFNAPELRERCIRYMIDRFQLANLKNPDDWWKVMESTQLEDELMDKFAKLRALNNTNNKRKHNETCDDNSSENNNNNNNKSQNAKKKCNDVEEEI